MHNTNEKMKVELCWVGAASIIIKINDELKIGLDPALIKKNEIIHFKKFESQRLIAPVYKKEDFNDVDIWLLTHGHLDHIDIVGKKFIDRYSKIVCSEDVNLILDDSKYINKVILGWNEEHKLSINGYEISIKAIPAIHGKNIFIALAYRKGNGYYVEIEKNEIKTTFYITGDTTYNSLILKSLGNKNIDYLFANLGQVRAKNFGGPLNMSIDMLNKFKDKLKPSKIIPLHYNDFSHYETKEEDIKNAGYDVLKRGKWRII